MATDHTLLNVVRSSGPGKSIDAVLIDNLENKPGSVIANSASLNDATNFVNELDLDIGNTVSIAGRNVLLYDCDDFTRRYFKTTHNKGKISWKIQKFTLSQTFCFKDCIQCSRINGYVMKYEIRALFITFLLCINEICFVKLSTYTLQMVSSDIHSKNFQVSES